jgi:hypothetical protein
LVLILDGSVGRRGLLVLLTGLEVRETFDYEIIGYMRVMILDDVGVWMFPGIPRARCGHSRNIHDLFLWSCWRGLNMFSQERSATLIKFQGWRKLS